MNWKDNDSSFPRLSKDGLGIIQRGESADGHNDQQPPRATKRLSPDRISKPPRKPRRRKIDDAAYVPCASDEDSDEDSDGSSSSDEVRPRRVERSSIAEPKKRRKRKRESSKLEERRDSKKSPASEGAQPSEKVERSERAETTQECSAIGKSEKEKRTSDLFLLDGDDTESSEVPQEAELQADCNGIIDSYQDQRDAEANDFSGCSPAVRLLGLSNQTNGISQNSYQGFPVAAVPETVKERIKRLERELHLLYKLYEDEQGDDADVDDWPATSRLQRQLACTERKNARLTSQVGELSSLRSKVHAMTQTIQQLHMNSGIGGAKTVENVTAEDPESSAKDHTSSTTDLSHKFFTDEIPHSKFIKNLGMHLSNLKIWMDVHVTPNPLSPRTISHFKESLDPVDAEMTGLGKDNWAFFDLCSRDTSSIPIALNAIVNCMVLKALFGLEESPFLLWHGAVFAPDHFHREVPLELHAALSKWRRIIAENAGRLPAEFWRSDVVRHLLSVTGSESVCGEVAMNMANALTSDLLGAPSVRHLLMPREAISDESFLDLARIVKDLLILATKVWALPIRIEVRSMSDISETVLDDGERGKIELDTSKLVEMEHTFRSADANTPLDTPVAMLVVEDSAKGDVEIIGGTGWGPGGKDPGTVTSPVQRRVALVTRPGIIVYEDFLPRTEGDTSRRKVWTKVGVWVCASDGENGKIDGDDQATGHESSDKKAGEAGTWNKPVKNKPVKKVRFTKEAIEGMDPDGVGTLMPKKKVYSYIRLPSLSKPEAHLAKVYGEGEPVQYAAHLLDPDTMLCVCGLNHDFNFWRYRMRHGGSRRR